MYAIFDPRTKEYLIAQYCAHTRRGFMLEYVFGHWSDAMKIEIKEVAEAVIIAMWPIGTNQPNPYELQQISNTLPAMEAKAS
jgi:hypothetical protein